MRRMISCAMACMLLAGCNGAELAQQLAASRARRDAALRHEVALGHLTPAQGADIMSADHAYDASSDRALTLSAMPDAPMPVWHPTYPTPAQYSAPPVYAPPSPSVSDCCALTSAPVQSVPRYVPYRAVAPLMPGISPDGTARN